ERYFRIRSHGFCSRKDILGCARRITCYGPKACGWRWARRHDSDRRLAPILAADILMRQRHDIEPTKMTSDLDIYRAANLVITRHGGGAVIEAARMVDRMLELGDPDGRALWQRIRRAIEVLQAAADSSVH